METPVTVELFYSDTWNDITADVLVRDSIRITRGRPDEASRIPPSTLNLSINNADGTYSPRNPMSPLYGLIGRNQPIRVSVNRIVDTFARTAVSGWGATDTGETWVRAGSGTSADFNVGSGYGSIRIGDVGSRYMTLSSVSRRDVDLVCDITCPVAVTGDSLSGYLVARFANTSNHYALRLQFDTSANVDVALLLVSGGSETTLDSSLNLFTPVNGVAFRARLSVSGSSILGKVWRASETEPTDWTVQATDTTHTAGTVGCRALRSASNANVSPALRFDNLVACQFRFHGEVESWPQRWNTKGSDVWAPITANGITRRLNAPGVTQTAYSPVRRYVMNSPVTVAYWPMEGYTEQPDLVASAVIGVNDASLVAYTPSIASPLNWQGDSTLPGSGNLPVLENNTTSIAGIFATTLINPGTGFGFAFWTRTAVPSGATSHGIDTQALQTYSITGPYSYAIALTQMPPGSSLASVPASGEVNVRVNLMLGNTIAQTVNITDLPFVDGWRHVYARITDSGSDLAVSISIDDEVVGTGTFTGVQLTTLQGVLTSLFGQDTTGDETSKISMGHAAVVVGSSANMDAFATGMYEAGFGYPDESVTDRISRLCEEDGFAVSIVGDTAEDESLGVQRIAPTLDLLQDAADADGGILYEPRHFLGFTYRNGFSLYNQDARLVLDYEDGDQVAPPLEPVEDTDATINDVTVTRLGGAFGRAVDDDGVLGVNTVGRYAQDVTLNLAEDTRCVQVANWKVHQGTVDEPRYPVVNVDLTALSGASVTGLVDAAVSLDIGDRLSITSPPSWLPPSTIEQLAEGFTEDLGSHHWLLAVNAVPESPYEVFQVETGDDNRSRIPAGNTVTNEALDTTETGVDIISVLARWIDSATYASQFPISIVIGGEQMTCTAITGTGLTQTMTVTRSVNGVVKSHAAGVAVQILRPAVIAL